jgi:hypothetical protein
MLPGISLLGHLSGVLVGLLGVYGVLELIFLPSPGMYICICMYTCMHGVNLRIACVLGCLVSALLTIHWKYIHVCLYVH